MQTRTREFRHIVDVDGQLIGIDAPVIDPITLMGRTDLTGERRLILVRHGLRTSVDLEDSIVLREDEVLFFETLPVPVRHEPAMPFAVRLAA
jgi:hypothetical protein